MAGNSRKRPKATSVHVQKEAGYQRRPDKPDRKQALYPVCFSAFPFFGIELSGGAKVTEISPCCPPVIMRHAGRAGEGGN